MKLGITGSRSITAFDFTAFFLLNHAPFRNFCLGSGLAGGVDEILHGGARGVDSLAAECAARLGIPCLIFPPDREKYPGGLIFRALQERNERIVDGCDLLLAVWDGVSRGTRNTFRYAERRGKPFCLVLPSGTEDAGEVPRSGACNLVLHEVYYS